MSADDGSSQPPAAGADKAQAPKAAATFSSFINKNTTGKKFAPKAARRRPGAAPAAATPAITVQLPTPAATQEPTPSAAEPLPTPAPTSTDDPPEADRAIVNESQTLATPESAAAPAETELRADTASNRPLVDTTAPKDTPAPQGEAVSTLESGSATQPTQQELSVDIRQEPEEQVTTPQDAPALPTETDIAAATTSDRLNAEETQLQREGGSQPWVAVNHPRDEIEEPAPAPSKRARQPTRARGGRKVTTESAAEVQEVIDDDSQQTQAKPGPKPRGKRKATTAGTEEDGQTQPPAKRTRRPRKARGTVGTETVDTTEGGAEQDVDGEDVAVVRRKPRQPKRKRRQTTEGEVDGESGQPKRKGRPPREPTPEDAENQIIDPENTFMDGLASRNIRVGKLSNREKQMREIDWVAVRQRRREEDARPMRSKEEQEAADRALNEAALNAQEDLGPRYHLVNGNIELVPDSGTVNREADADREIADYEIIEDRDITSRITSRSFMKNNKRFPNEFILPGQGMRWNRDSTDLFYQGLKSFGTDFQMISHMFPGTTRRSIKTKFTREERENPERVKEALQGRSEIATHWDVFLKASQMEEESFADADEIKRQMAETEAQMREQIEAARLETEERNRQKIAAGVLEEGGEPGDKENGKGKKKRREKGKHVTFQQEEGVEIVGTIDDDENWGQE